MVRVGDQSEEAPPVGRRTRARIVHAPRTVVRKVAPAAVTPVRHGTNRVAPGRRRWTSKIRPRGARAAAQRTVTREPAGTRPRLAVTGWSDHAAYLDQTLADIRSEFGIEAVSPRGESNS